MKRPHFKLNFRRVIVPVMSTLLISCGSGGDNGSQASKGPAPTATPQPESTAFLNPTPGREAILDSNGGSAKGATVCDTIEQLKQIVVDQDAGSGCHSRAGEQVDIIVRRAGTIGQLTALKSRAKNGGWDGVELSLACRRLANRSYNLRQEPRARLEISFAFTIRHWRGYSLSPMRSIILRIP